MPSSSHLRRVSAVIAVLGVCAASAASASAQTYTWDGGGSGANWTTGQNWVGDVAPVSGTSTDIVFGSSGALQMNSPSNFLGAALTVRSVTFNENVINGVAVRTTTAATSSTAANITFNGGGSGAFVNVLSTASSGTLTYIAIGVASTGGSIVLADNLTVTMSSTSGGPFVFGRRVTGAFSVTKDGPGTMQFSSSTTAGSSDYSGGLVLNEGVVQNNSTAGFGTGTVTFNGGILRLANIAVTNPITVSGSNLKTFAHGNASSGTYGGSVTLGDTTAGNVRVDIQNTGNLVFNGVMSGSGGLEKLGVGSGLLLLNAANTYTGPTTISTGTLRLGASSSLASGSITIASGARLDSLVTGGFNLGIGQALGGKGTLAGNANILNGSTLAVDPLTSGTLATTGSLTFGNNFGIANISVPSWNALATGTYTIVAGAQDFTSAGLQNFGFNQKATVSGTQQAYFAASGNNLQLVVVPEPATIALAVGGLVSVGFVGLRRLRRRG